MAKSKKQVRHERVRTKSLFSVNLSLNALVGIVLAILGTFILFFNGSAGLMPLLIRIIGVVFVCIGAVATVNYFRNKNSANSLIGGIIQIVVGLALLIAASQISQWIFLALGILMAAYGVYTLITSKGDTLSVILGIAFIAIGILVILYTFNGNWAWMSDWGYIPIGISAYCGALFFLFA